MIGHGVYLWLKIRLCGVRTSSLPGVGGWPLVDDRIVSLELSVTWGVMESVIFLDVFLNPINVGVRASCF